MNLRHAIGTALCTLLLASGSGALAVNEDVGWWEEKVDFHGFFSVGYLGSSDNNYLAESDSGTFDFNEAGLNLSTQLTDDLRLGVQVFARDLGVLGNHDSEIDWAYLDWRVKDWFGVRAGRFKLPYGLYNETADVDAVRTTVLLPQSVYNLSFRDFLVSTTGGSFYGNVALGRGSSFDYQLFVGQNSFSKDGSIARNFDDLGAFTIEHIESRMTSGLSFVWNAPLEGLRTGYSRIRYDDNKMAVDVDPFFQGMGLPPQTTLEIPEFTVQVYSAEFTRNRWVLAGEYTNWQGAFINPYFGQDTDFGGYYGSGSYRINDRFEVGSYYSVFYADNNDKDGLNSMPNHKGWQKDLAVSLRVDLSFRWIVKLELHDMDGTGQVMYRENPDGLERNWRVVAAKASYAF